MEGWRHEGRERKGRGKEPSESEGREGRMEQGEE
jgi:hypothetical protein